MHVTARAWDSCDEKAEKKVNTFKIEGCTHHTAQSLLDSLRSYLRASAGVWPELGNYEVREKPRKKR